MHQISKAHWNVLRERINQNSYHPAFLAGFFPLLLSWFAQSGFYSAPLLAVVVMTTYIYILQLIKPMHGTLPHLTLPTTVG